MLDPTEPARRAILAEQRARPQAREQLVARYGPYDVFDSEEMQRIFEALHFLAPFVHVKRRSDGTTGTLAFQHAPRFYFGWTPDT